MAVDAAINKDRIEALRKRVIRNLQYTEIDKNNIIYEGFVAELD
jgi:hypothetical protein